MKRLRAAAAPLLAGVLLLTSGCFNVKFREPERPAGMTAPSATDPYAAVTAAPTYTAPPATVVTVPAETTTLPFSTDSDEYVDDTTVPIPTVPTTVPVTAAPSTPDQMTRDQLLQYFNNTLNRIKTGNVGFTKTKKTDVLDLQLSNQAANSVVGLVKNALLSSDAATETVGRGSSGVAVFSPSGKPYISALTAEDITAITCTKNGAGYIVKVAVKSETNPEANGSAMSRAFDFMTVDDVLNVYAPKVGATVARQDIKVVFSDCTAEMTVDGAGRVTAYRTYVKGVMNMLNATVKKVISINTDVAVTLASTTDYTNFDY